ncbi:MAG: type II secretion system protein [Verrucomicrobiia bacterium]
MLNFLCHRNHHWNAPLFRVISLRPNAFTLIELISAVAIVAMLVGLVTPAITGALDKAHQMACASNLRQLTTMALAAQDNDGKIPYIEPDPTSPIYEPEVGAKGLFETLQPYGATPKLMQCRADVKGPNFFASKGSSYEWRPLIDGENVNAPVIYSRRGEFVIAPDRYRLMFDFDPVHNGRRNTVFANGIVKVR